jgi:hypothetical protein
VYTKPCVARWYHVDDDQPACEEFYITAGCLQGCVSGPRLYAIGTLKAAEPFRSQLCQVADDANLIGPSAIRNASAVVAAFKKIDQVLDGPKLRVFIPARWKSDEVKRAELACLEQNPLFKDVKPECDGTYPVLGGAICSQIQPSFESLTAALWKLRKKLISRVTTVLQLECSIQCKMLILRQLPYALLHATRTTFHPLAVQYFQQVDEIVHNAVNFVIPDTDLSNPDHLSSLQSSIEDGGLGFLPLAAIRHHVHEQLIHLANSTYLKLFDLSMAPLDHVNKPAKYVWRRETGGEFSHFDRDGWTFKTGEFRSWLHCRPATSLTRISDKDYVFQWNVMLYNLTPPPGAGLCKSPKWQTPPNLQTMSRQEFTEHFFTCASCCSSMFNVRHNEVVYAIRKTNKFHSIPDTVPNFTELALPGKARGGPDLLVFADADAVDVSCVYAAKPKEGESLVAAMSKRFHEKKSKYEEFEEKTKYRVVPFIVSHLGVVAKQTRDMITPWKKRAIEHTYQDELFNNVQIALMRAQRNTFDLWSNQLDREVILSAGQSHVQHRGL